MRGIQNSSPTKGQLVSISTLGTVGEHKLKFMFNPTTINESRSVNYNFSEGQGQSLPLAQFGMIGTTNISFELFMFKHVTKRTPLGLKAELASLRRLTLPRTMTRRTAYDQVQPPKYILSLSE